MAKTGPKLRTTEKFIEDAIAVHGNVYGYSLSEYTGLENKLTIICPVHGEFQQTPHQHLRGRHCSACANVRNGEARAMSQEVFIEKAKKIHGDKFDYSKVNYISGQCKVTITCPTHGDFQQKAENHINLQHGCRKCYHDSRKGSGGGGYALEYFVRNPEKKHVPGTLYIARMKHHKDDFIKIGVTATGGVKDRFYHKAMHGTEIIPLYEDTLTLYAVFQREQEILSVLKEFRYYPNRKFSGYTECFKINQEVIRTLQDHFGINIKDKLES